ELYQSVQGKVCNPNVLSVESSAECVARQIDGRTIRSYKIPAKHSDKYWIKRRSGQTARSGCTGVALVAFITFVPLITFVTLRTDGTGSAWQSLQALWPL